MKSIKLTAIFTILTVAIVGCLWAMDILPPDEASKIFGRTISVVLIIGFSLSAIFFIARPTSNKSDHSSKEPGPKF